MASPGHSDQQAKSDAALASEGAATTKAEVNGASEAPPAGQDTEMPDAPPLDQEGSKQRDNEKERRSGKGKHDSERRSEKKDKERDRGKGRDRDRDRDRDRHKDRRHRDKETDTKDREDKKDREKREDGRSKSRERSKRRSSRDRRSRHRSRSRSKERSSRRRSRSRRRSPSRDRRRSRSRHRRRSPSRDRRRRFRSRSRRRSQDSFSEDGFGGYVPRKRQEAPMPGSGFSTAFSDPYAALRSKKVLPTDPEGLKKEMREQQLKARHMVLQQQASSAVAAASKTQREIYVGNLVQGLVTEDSLRQLFNSTMKAAFPQGTKTPGDPCVSVSMHSEGRYAFVELKSSEMASAALQLSGQVQLLGQNISVGRPSGYVDPSAAQMAAAQAATALQSFQGGGMSLDQAEEAMNSIHMPGAQSASEPPQDGVSPGPLALPPPPGTAGTPPAVPGTPPPGAPTPYLQVEGMVNVEVLVDDEEYAEVIEDLKEECGKHGQILSVTVPRPSNPASAPQVFGQGNYGKAFVQFADPAACQQAKQAVHGRLFAGVTIQANFISQQAFNAAVNAQ